MITINRDISQKIATPALNAATAGNPIDNRPRVLFMTPRLYAYRAYGYQAQWSE
jgi:hypothetical protein